MAYKIALFLFFVLVFCEARHTHPRKEWSEGEEERVIALHNDHNAMETEIIKVAPTKVFAHHNILFFKSYDPCEDGLKLDYQGICREVWF